MNERMMAMGRVMITTNALRTWKRKMMMTRLTIRLSSISFSFSVAMDLRISSERS